MKDLFFTIVFAFIAVFANGQTFVNSMPNHTDTVVVSGIDTNNLEIIEYVEGFSHIEVEVELPKLGQKTSTAIIKSGVFGVNVKPTNEQRNKVNVSPRKQDKEIFININSKDLEFSRKIKVFVPVGSVVEIQ